ncbi:MAG: hypothetical protein P8J26_09920, partial [Pseudomonadales bacterium]|nr:hypothetical protein [Pseudomonadales bacterium]
QFANYCPIGVIKKKAAGIGLNQLNRVLIFNYLTQLSITRKSLAKKHSYRPSLRFGLHALLAVMLPTRT